MKSYLIIGSGLIGRLTAWRLLQAGHQVSLLSKDNKQGTDSAGYVAAAMIAPLTEAATSEALIKTIGMHSYGLWPKWLKELPKPIFYQNNGTLVIAHQEDKSELVHFQKRANHVLEASDYQLLERDLLAQHEPNLAKNFNQALFFEKEACLDNRHLYRVLTDLLTKNCPWYQCDELGELTDTNLESLCQQHFDCSLDQFDSVIDSRGNGAKADLSNLRSVRGEIIRVYAPEVDIQHCIRLMHPRYPLYLAPRPNHEYVLGATVIESDDRSEVSVRSGLELLSALYSVHKGFSEARIIEMAAHCRPAFPDNLPAIKQTSWGYQVNGFYRHGYLFAPAIIEELLKILNTSSPQLTFGELYDLNSNY